MRADRGDLLSETVLDRRPLAMMHPPARGMDVGQGKIRLVATLDRRQEGGLHLCPQRLALSERGKRRAQIPCQRVYGGVVESQSLFCIGDRGRVIAGFEGGL